MEFVMLAIWYFFAAAVFAASTIVYASTLIGFDLVERFPQLTLLHLFAMAAAAPGIVYLGRDFHRGADLDPWLKHNSPWVRRVWGVLGLNAMACFVLFLVILFVVGKGGEPEKRGDKFVAVSHGNVVCELTEAQYHSLYDSRVRFFSSFWMFFSGCPPLIFAVTHGKRLRPSGIFDIQPLAGPIDDVNNFVKSLTSDDRDPELHIGHGMADIVGARTRSSEVVSVEGPDGCRQIFRSIEEVPPDLRALYESGRVPNRREITSVTFTVAGPNGQERTYHSLDEMPPEIRELFERLRPPANDV
jgi:hypothetical protein